MKNDLDALLELGDNLYAVANLAFRTLANDAVEEAKRNIDPARSGLHNRSGALRDSIRLINWKQMAPNVIGEALLRAAAPYARIHEYGGVIRAKNARYLVFVVNNRWVKTQQVTIPARPYLEPGVQNTLSLLELYLDRAIKEVLEHVKN